MKTESTRYAGPRSQRHLILVTGVFIFLIALAMMPHLTTSASSVSIARALGVSRDLTPQSRQDSAGGFLTTTRRPGFVSATLFQPPVSETIATFAADCTTPKTTFIQGETVCAITDNVDLNFPGGRFVNWLAPGLIVAYGGSGVTDITMNPQTFLYAPTVVGTWKVTIAEPNDISQTPAIFTVTQAPQSITTYAADCMTPQSLFTLGDVVCAKAVGFDPAFNRRLAWIDPAGITRTFVPITSDPQTNSFTLPTAETELIDIFLVDNRGTWKVNVVSSRGSQLASAPFQVRGASPRADLSVGKGVTGGTVDAGSNFSFTVAVTNFGPNPAQNVVLTDPAPPDTSVLNATFFSVTQISGPTFSCSGTAPLVCRRGTTMSPLFLNAGETAVFELTYTASGAPGSTIANTVKATSDTTELNDTDNTASSGGLPPQSCPGTGRPPGDTTKR